MGRNTRTETKRSKKGKIQKKFESQSSKYAQRMAEKNRLKNIDVAETKNKRKQDLKNNIDTDIFDKQPEGPNAIYDRPVRLIVIGAGNRGNVYSKFALENPELLQVVAVAEPRDFSREKFMKKYDIDADKVYKNWKDITNLPEDQRIEADAVLICTLDQYHMEPAVGKIYLKKIINTIKPLQI